MRLKASPDGDEMREPSGEIKFPNWRQFYGKDRLPAGATLFDPRSVADEVRSYIAEYPEENHYPVLLPPHRGREGGGGVAYQRVRKVLRAGPGGGGEGDRSLHRGLRKGQSHRGAPGGPPGTKRAKLSYEPGEDSAPSRGPLYLESGAWRRLLMTVRV